MTSSPPSVPAEGSMSFHTSGAAYDSFMGRYSTRLAPLFADKHPVAARVCQHRRTAQPLRKCLEADFVLPRKRANSEEGYRKNECAYACHVFFFGRENLPRGYTLSFAIGI